jgi:tetratricopeptide (TPR) repeat protein
LQWAFSRLKFEQYPTAAYEFITAYNLLEKNQDKFPDFTLNKKGLGLMHALLGAVPEQFQWILNLAGLQGSINLGLSEMDAILNDNDFKVYENEVLFLLSFLQINLNNNALCQKYLNRIGGRYQENLLLNFTAARLSHVLGMNEYCLKVLENRPSNEGKYAFYYLDYLQGMSYLYKLDYKKAEQYFNHFLKNFNGYNYIKSTYHKLAWISYLKGENHQYKYFEKALTEGTHSIDEDKVALKDAQRNYISHTRLLRTRLLYDGGYYEESLSVISEFKEVSEYIGYLDEYWYRLARIESKIDYDDKVLIKRFEKSHELGKSTTNYYAPMSALQIGLIYEKQNKYEQAAIYFEKCLAMSNFDYDRGIHQKAKAGISRISD